MRKQLRNLKMWRRAAGLLMCVAFLCLLLLGGCARDLGRGASANSSVSGGAASAASSISSASSLTESSASAASSSPGGSKPGNAMGGSSSSGASVNGESKPGGAVSSSSGSSVSTGSSAAGSASSGSGAASPPLASSAPQAGASGVTAGESLNSLLILVNREHALPADYIPAGLTKLTVPFASNALPERRQLRKEAAEAIVLLFEAAKKDSIELFCYSGYRSYASQSDIYYEKVKTIGVEATNKYYAAPGHSEHQTGLAMDVTNAAGVKAGLNTDFAQSKEGVWLAANAKRFGFIIRYPDGKQDITGFAYEPWHLRYVGVKAALEIGKAGQTLEEFLQ